MRTCPHCQSENPADAVICSHCSMQLASAPPGDEVALPDWLQQLEPEQHGADGADAIAVTAVTVPEPAGQIARFNASDPVTEDTVVEQVAVAPARGAATAGHRGSEALIDENDLPAWLRAWDANETAVKEGASAKQEDDLSWIGDSDADDPPPLESATSAESEAPELELAWHAAAHPVARQHSKAEAVFAQMASPSPAPDTEAAIGTSAPARRSTLHASLVSSPVAPGSSIAPAVNDLRAVMVSRSEPRRQGRTAATLVLAAALMFFVVSLAFFLFTIGPFR